MELTLFSSMLTTVIFGLQISGARSKFDQDI